MIGIDIYNKKVWQSPLNCSISFVNTGFERHNVYNLIAAMKIKNENSIDSASNIVYQISKFHGTSTAFNFLFAVASLLDPWQIILSNVEK